MPLADENTHSFTTKSRKLSLAPSYRDNLVCKVGTQGTGLWAVKMEGLQTRIPSLPRPWGYIRYNGDSWERYSQPSLIMVESKKKLQPGTGYCGLVSDQGMHGTNLNPYGRPTFSKEGRLRGKTIS